MTDPRISIIIPSQNRPTRLRECLVSLERQTVPPDRFEVVVIDDGSQPAYPDDLNQCGWTFAFRLIRQDRAGPAAARNRGVCEARTELIALLDDDCRPDPDWLSLLLAARRDHPDAMLGGTVSNGLHRDFHARVSHLILDLVYEHFNADATRCGFLASNNLLCARDEYLRLGGFDEHFRIAGGKDRDFCDRWRAGGKPIVWVRDSLTEHRHSQNFYEFLNIHWRYGRGAYHYQRRRRERGTGSIQDDMGFFQSVRRNLPGKLHRYPGLGCKLRLLGLLGCWQIANCTGYFYESVRARSMKSSCV